MVNSLDAGPLSPYEGQCMQRLTVTSPCTLLGWIYSTHRILDSSAMVSGAAWPEASADTAVLLQEHALCHGIYATLAVSTLYI